MLSKTIFFALAFIGASLYAQPPTFVPGGDVYGTWLRSGSPFLIQDNIQIPVDSTLIIEPGVIVEFQGHYALNVQGRLIAVGTETDTIRFTVNDTTGFGIPDTTLGSWNGIRFTDTPAHNDTSHITYCRLEFAKAVSPIWHLNAGAAICIISFDKVIISNCLITNNCTADPQGENASGGAIHMFESDIKLINNTITKNRSDAGGAVQFHTSNPIFINNTISHNHAIDGGGIAAGGTSFPIFTNDHIIDNTAERNGGGLILWNTSIVTCTNVTFRGNQAVWGGGIGVSGGELHTQYCLLSENHSTLWGGGIAGDFATLNIDACEFLRNSSEWGSGGLHADHADVMIRNCEFIENTADFGGAVHAVSSELLFTNDMFWGNSANSAGGMHIENSNLSIDSCIFEQNDASDQVGGVDFRADTTGFENIYNVTITHSDFYQNSATSIIAGLRIEQFDSVSPLTTVLIDGCNFLENEAARVTAIRITGAIEDFIISNCIFRDNLASSQNAGCHIRSNCTGRIENCLFVFNSIGASVSISLAAVVEFFNCTFAYNTSAGHGGISLRSGSKAIATNCIFWGNRQRQIGLTTAGETETIFISNYNNIQDGIDSIFVSDSLSIINWGDGNIDIDPLFVDTSAADFHLQDSSPCIGAGVNCILLENEWRCAPVFDLDGRSRPAPEGSSSDMGIYEHALGLPTAMAELQADLPEQFQLYQNYPNPFNSTTIISFSLIKPEFVELRIINMLGAQIKTLVDRKLAKGEYNIELNGNNLASGIYYYQIKAGDFKKVRKMLLLK